MPEDLSALTRPQRQRLLEALQQIPIFSTEEGRNTLLAMLPAALRAGLKRSSIAFVDLSEIIDQSTQWGAIEDGTPALYIVIENALIPSRGSAAGRTLRELYLELTEQVLSSDLAESSTDKSIPLIKEDAHRGDDSNSGTKKAAGEIPMQDSQGDVVQQTRKPENDEQPKQPVPKQDSSGENEWRVREQAIGASWARAEQRSFSSSISSVAFSPDNEFFAISTENGLVALYRTEDGAYIRSFSGGRRVHDVTFSPDGSILAAAVGKASFFGERVVQLSRVIDGTALHKLAGHLGDVISVAFAPHGHILASGSRDSTVQLWRLTDGKLLRTLIGHKRAVTSVAFASGGDVLASGSEDRTVRLWRPGDGMPLHKLTGHTYGVTSVAFAPNGQILASGSFDETVTLWSVFNGMPLHKLTGHTDGVTSVAFAPDGQICASGSRDNTVRLYRVSNGELLRVLDNHTYGVNDITFAPNGKILAVAAEDRTVRLWRITDGTLWHRLGYPYDRAEAASDFPFT